MVEKLTGESSGLIFLSNKSYQLHLLSTKEKIRSLASMFRLTDPKKAQTVFSSIILFHFSIHLTLAIIKLNV